MKLFHFLVSSLFYTQADLQQRNATERCLQVKNTCKGRNLILTLQGNGDKAGVSALQTSKALVNPALQKDLTHLQQKGIPVDIVFEQGVDVLGLK